MIAANQGLLDQACRLLVRLDDQQYGGIRGHHSSAGAHLRHVIEHYQCFVEGLPAGRIDYDARRRDVTIETSTVRAIAVLHDLARDLDQVRALPLDRSVMVQMRCAADEPTETWAASTAGRELQFLVSHAVHHYALIRMLLERDGVAVEADFGIAPSTVHARAAK